MHERVVAVIDVIVYVPNSFNPFVIPLTPPCRVSEDTLRAVGPFHVVPMQGEIKYRAQSMYNRS